jgi:L-seryl-tRNA(Ser) seleniumtransferase
MENSKELQHVQKVINATGVVVHTNLGRTPLPEKLFQELIPRLCSYSNLEFELDTGKRGSRDTVIRNLLKNLSGAEEALVVNNNASAIFLMLKTLTAGKEVIVSRGELVEIGGSFRIPDIMSESGAVLVEVGTTNRTRLSDYEQAINENTAAILKVHPSNYVIEGFTESVEIPRLVELAKARGLYCLHDWGSGTFYQFEQKGLKDYPTAQQEIGKGVDVLSFSADKLLGAVQGGIILGRKEAVDKMRSHPLYRALRADKVTLGIIETVLGAYFEPESLKENITGIGLLERTVEEIREQAHKTKDSLQTNPDSEWKVSIQETDSRTGGGALPELPLPSCALVIQHHRFKAQQIQEWLRSQPTPVIVRIMAESVWLDFRTIFKEDEETLLNSLNLLISTTFVGGGQEA